MHNCARPAVGEIAILPGPAMAGADFFDIVIIGLWRAWRDAGALEGSRRHGRE